MILLGSSPRGRGKRRHAMPTRIAHRLIPAWAGKTACRLGCEHAETAHPRVGGENSVAALSSAKFVGSSPRGRGKRRFDRLPARSIRLIPAWAGKTFPGHATPPSASAHPRVGGENISAGVLARRKQGSSPRGRGKLRDGPCHVVHTRLIPAWAGKTACVTDVTRARWAHPRVGGENASRRSTE